MIHVDELFYLILSSLSAQLKNDQSGEDNKFAIPQQ
jgi:hypothetical protein